MSSEDGRYHIVHSGEVYNYKTVRFELEQRGYQFHSQTDTEVILNAFQLWGEDCLQHFNGMFAFAIYDRTADELFLVRDRIGAKPLYYSALPEGFIFASEVKAILASGLVVAEPDYFSLHTPTRFQIPPFTGFKNILKVPPGHYLKYTVWLFPSATGVETRGSELRQGKS
jgi:asparagine synthase (glutamine-hydrolysing)